MLTKDLSESSSSLDSLKNALLLAGNSSRNGWIVMLGVKKSDVARSLCCSGTSSFRS